ncbi:hypothetical protein GCM10023143_23890 [Compostibacter hankyongensis]|uniref:Cytochrome c domain-containing protein n=2 Tax=Compostibacter hankyongensis TaxID=1007089 RepID=A0ABP8FYH8_9BACT
MSSSGKKMNEQYVSVGRFSRPSAAPYSPEPGSSGPALSRGAGRLLTALVVAGALAVSCNQAAHQSSREEDSLAMREKYATSPVLSPEEAMKHFKLEQGFDIRQVASEPLVHTPTAMIFDDRGRMWVVEMEGYMHDTSGTGEDKPVSKIVIVEDTNHDGKADKRKVFMDSLVLPRAICLIDGGVLVAEPPKLWFVEDNNDVAGKKTLVDPTYAEGGNVEHQPNGLLRGLDNWIYNAKSDKRYRKINGRWVVEHTHFRGQWGVSQDNYGRLFYNNNSENLLGDYFSPGLGSGNLQQRSVSGFNENIVPDNRTYPIRATPGVNRGYMKGVLDDSLRLVNFTAACSPLIFRSKALGEDYENNAFVAEPSANLVKRNILTDNGYKVTGKQAWQGKEFLASDDERFRPVTLTVGPDGALYVVDMYRGIIQHKTYLTPYLNNEIKMRELTDPLSCGRIYRIVRHGSDPKPVDMSGKSPEALVAALDDDNSWVRETAQHMLIDQKAVQTVPLLRKKLQEDANKLGRIHALWTLEGLGQLQASDIQVFLQSNDPLQQQQGLTAATAMLSAANAAQWLHTGGALLQKGDTLLAPYIAFMGAAATQFAKAPAEALLLDAAKKYKDNRYVADAVISGLSGEEEKFLARFRKETSDSSCVFARRLKKVISDIAKKKAQSTKTDKRLVRGKQLFETICQACHGEDGEGIKSLGAPLNGSNWVQGDKHTLLSIVLYGLVGPIKVGNKLYKVPEVGGEMPGIGSNDQLSDKDIAQIVSYIRNSWNNKAGMVTEADVKAVREKEKGRQEPFTMKDLQ